MCMVYRFQCKNLKYILKENKMEIYEYTVHELMDKLEKKEITIFKIDLLNLNKKNEIVL